MPKPPPAAEWVLETKNHCGSQEFLLHEPPLQHTIGLKSFLVKKQAMVANLHQLTQDATDQCALHSSIYPHSHSLEL